MIPLEATLCILSWEQLRLRPYADAVGKLTVGWGHLVLPGEDDLRKEITRGRANELLLLDLARAERGVSVALPGLPLQDHQRGALVSFCFNTGHAALGETMGLGRALREGRYRDVPAEMRRWVKGTTPDGRKVTLAGLVERREMEVALWKG